MTNRTRLRLTGVAALACFTALVLLAVVRPGNPFSGPRTYYAVFDTAQGLGAIDRDVRIAGVPVGTMGEVERIGDDVRIAIELDTDTLLHADARLDMRPHTLFEGSNFVDLSPGSPSAPELEQGATIPRTQTTNYVTLDEALRVLRPRIREDLRTLARVGSRTLRGQTISGLQRTLRAAPPLMADLAPAARAAIGTEGTELSGAVVGLSRTVDELERARTELLPLAARTARTTEALAVDGGRPLDAALAALPGALRELRAAAPVVQDVVSRTERLSRTVRPALPVLADAIREGVPVARRAIPVAVRGTPLVRDARLIAARLADARSSLVDMFELTEPSLAKFDSLFEVFNAETKLGGPSGVTQLVGGAFTGFDAVFRPFQTAAQNPGAPGHQGRVGVYVNPTGLVGLAEQLGGGGQQSPLARGELPGCERIARVSKRAALQLRGIGACA